MTDEGGDEIDPSTEPAAALVTDDATIEVPVDAALAPQFEVAVPAKTPVVTTKRRRPLRVLVFVAIALVAVAGGAIAKIATRGPSTQSRYLAELTTARLRTQFPADRAAVLSAKRTCAGLDAGKADKGYARDKVGVEFYCPSYLARFVVVPTPEEQQAFYLHALASGGLSGKFTSDAAAVVHANKVCADLKRGGKQQGLAEDKVGVQVYCNTFLDGYRVLRTITVDGTFELIDYSIYAPGIFSAASGCTGTGGYDDIHAGTEVTVTNDAGVVLTTTELGAGTGSDTSCTFPFRVKVTEGEDHYDVTVSHRGSLSHTFSELDSSGIALTLGP